MSIPTFEQFVVLAGKIKLRVRLAFDGRHYVYSVWRDDRFVSEGSRRTRMEADHAIRDCAELVKLRAGA